MTLFIRNLLTLIFVGLACPPAYSEGLREEITRDLTQLHEDYWAIRRFLGRYGLELVREKNFDLKQEGKIDGQIKGSLDGSGYSVQVGQLSSLMRGIGELGTFLTANAKAIPGVTLDSGLNSVMRGLDNWGWGHMKISGELKGSLTGYFKGEGTGVVINKEPAAYFIFVRPTKLVKYREYLKYSMLQKPANSAAVEEVMRFLESPLLIDEKELNEILGRREKILNTVESLEKKLIGAGANSDLKDLIPSAMKMKDDTQNWLRSKRILAVTAAAPESIRLREAGTMPAGYRISKLAVSDSFLESMHTKERKELRTVIASGISSSPIVYLDGRASPGEGFTFHGDIFGTDVKQETRALLQAYLESTKLHEPQVVGPDEKLTSRLSTSHSILKVRGNDSLFRRKDEYRTDNYENHRPLKNVMSLGEAYVETEISKFYFKNAAVTFDGELVPKFLSNAPNPTISEVRLLPN